MICNNDCFGCLFEECIKEEVDELDVYKAHLLDKEFSCNPDTNSTTYRYNHSDKRKAVSKKYLATDKGKETHKRSCQNYAKNHPDRVRAKSRLYYERHKKEIKVRRLLKERGQDNDNR